MPPQAQPELEVTWTSTRTYNLTSIFTPPSDCLAPTYTLAPDGIDRITSGTAFKGVLETCFPAGFPIVQVVNSNHFLWTGTPTVGSLLRGGTPSTIAATPLKQKRDIVHVGQMAVGRGAVHIRQAGAGAPMDLETAEIPQTYFSPGICPSGYITAAQTYDGTATFATCCPSGMTVYRDPSGNAANCTSALNTMTYVSGAVTSETGAIAVASSIVVAFQSSDLSLWATTASTSTETSRPQPSEGLPSPTAAAAESDNSNGASLSSGAKAGISIAAIAVALITLAFVLLWMRKRNRRKSGTRSNNDAVFGKAELSAEEKARIELGQDEARHESDGSSKPPEMEAAPVRAELEGDWRGWEAPSNER